MGTGSSKADVNSTPVEKITDHEKSITCMALSEDESLLVTGSDDGTARMWSSKTSSTECLGIFRGHTDYITCITVYDTYVLTGGADATIRKWDMTTCECLDVYGGHDSRIFRLLCNGNWIFSSSYDRTCRAWRFDTSDLDDDEDPCIRVFRGHEKAVLPLVYIPGVELTGIGYSPDDINPSDLLLTGSADGTARSWSVETGGCLKIFKGHRGPISCMATDIDGEVLFTASMDKTVRSWDIASGRCLKTFEGHENGIISMFVGKTMLYTGSADGTAKSWVIDFGECTRTYKGHQHSVTCVQVCGGILFTASGDMSVRAFDAKAGSLRKTYVGHEAGVMSLAYVGGYIFSGGSDGVLMKWDAQGLVENETKPALSSDKQAQKEKQNLRMAQLEAQLDDYVDLNRSFGSKALMRNLHNAKSGTAWA